MEKITHLNHSFLSRVVVLAAVSTVLFLWGCGGGGPGAPGSEGSEDTGVILEASIVPLYNDTNTNSVDVFRQICTPATESSPAVYEVFTDHQATVTFTARSLNPQSTFRLGDLTIEKYSVEFFPSQDSLGAPPIETDTRYATTVIPAPTGVTSVKVEATVVLVDLTRKFRYLSDLENRLYTSHDGFLNNYTAVYTFEGKNDFGDSFEVKAQTDFQIGSFDYCTTQ